MEGTIMQATLSQLERLVDQLTPLEQIRLLEYLTPRIARSLAAAAQPVVSTPAQATSQAWSDFFRIGDAIAADDTPEMETLTAAVLAMRR
jgi:hypothetical protein